MAQTWPPSRARRAILRAVDLIGRTLSFPLRSRPDVEEPKRILVIEPWHIGDVVLATPLLRALRETFANARISLLGKPHARELLRGSGLVDEFIVADLPWTRETNKYALNVATARQMRALVKELRNRKFDLTIDARMDIRSNLLAALTGAPIRVGYDIGGGGWLLTRSLPADRDAFHKINDWLALYELVPGAKSFPQHLRLPTLVISESEAAEARRRLLAESRLSAPVIGYHSGGSHPGKRWPLSLFEQLARDLSSAFDGTHIFFLGPADETPVGLPSTVVVRRVSLREFMAEVSLCDLLICNDSGPMHIADALGVPVIAIFEVGNPQWYGPSGSRSVVIRGELAGRGMSAAPLEMPPANPVPLQKVKETVHQLLSRTAARDEHVSVTTR